MTPLLGARTLAIVCLLSSPPSRLVLHDDDDDAELQGLLQSESVFDCLYSRPDNG